MLVMPEQQPVQNRVPLSKTIESPYLVPFKGGFNAEECATMPPEGTPGAKACNKERRKLVKELAELQRLLYADGRHALLLVFQALDAAGKDSCIRRLLSGVNPAGCRVTSFKQPSREELSHDFLWRGIRQLPRRGEIGVFNRSYYEEVLVLRVHPEYLAAQNLVGDLPLERLWKQRYKAIRDHEQHLAASGTTVLKFWLNVSAEEQRRRFLDRLETPEKQWKFSAGDLREAELRPRYIEAFGDALAATSRPHAPWYALPADDKPFLRLSVARIVVKALRKLDLRYPAPDGDEAAQFAAHAKELREVIE
jgi:PPK2 family polyphosphate:nucleotide phosphotransferase